MSHANLKRILHNPALPSLPAIAVQVIELASVPDIPLKQIAQTVSLDQAMTGKILKTVNSSYYGLSKPVSSIERAMGYLGMNTVKTLVLSFSLVDTFGHIGKDRDGFDLNAHWRRAIHSATAARLFATAVGAVEADDAFIAALMQDIGVLAMFAAMDEEYARAIAGKPHGLTLEAEREGFGFDHTEVGAQLCEAWRLPEHIRAGVQMHHSPKAADERFHDMLMVIELASLAAESLVPGAGDTPVKRLASKAARVPRLAQNGWEHILRQTADGAEELSSLFKLDIGASIDPDAVLASAGELLVRHQIDADRRATQLEQKNVELKKATEHDALTGAHNRAFFDARLAEEFEKARAGSSPLAVAFFDADKFKSVNDTHGHQAGDAVLVQLARRASQTIADEGIVCRYGGEEFAIILPGLDRRGAGLVAERLRKIVEASPFDVSGTDAKVDLLPVTVSVGVAAFDPAAGGLFASPESLLLAADKAVYAAKHAGRNCVRVFSPKIGGTKANDPSASRSSAGGPSPSAASTPSTRLLLIEDDTMHAMLIAMMGKSIPGLAIDIASTGEQAMERLAAAAPAGRLPDAVLCDLGLPGLPGIEVLRRIRAEISQSLPVVVVTGADAQREAERCLAAGASAFIEKRALCENPRQGLLDIIEEWCVPPAISRQAAA